MTATSKLTPDLLSEASSKGCSWLAEEASKGRLIGESAALRRLAWAHLLGVTSGTPEDWVKALDEGRAHYNGLLEAHQRESNVKTFDPKICNPLAKSVDNPFNKVHANDELLREIWKDVERTFTEVDYLSSTETRKTLQRILFHWCRSANPAKAASDSYRQGMNELAAVVLAVCKAGEWSEASWETAEALGQRLCGRQYTEADAFVLFSKLMSLGLRPMFLPTYSASSPSKTGSMGPLGGGSILGELPPSKFGVGGGGFDQPPSSAVLARCKFIFDFIVKKVDEPLHSHLVGLEIEPQVFLLRWLRLLFCREVGLDDTMVLWDGFLTDAATFKGDPLLKYPTSRGGAETPWAEASQAAAALPLVDYVAAAHLRGMKGDLAGLDQTGCLMRLMAPRPPACGVTSLLDTAKRLRDFPQSDPASDLVTFSSSSSLSAPTGTSSRSPTSGENPFSTGGLRSSPLSSSSTTARRSGETAPFGRSTSPRGVGGYAPPDRSSVRSSAPLGDPLGGLRVSGPLGSSNRGSLWEGTGPAAQRGQQLLSAAAQGAQGLFSVGMQAVQQISEKLSEQLENQQQSAVQRSNEPQKPAAYYGDDDDGDFGARGVRTYTSSAAAAAAGGAPAAATSTSASSFGPGAATGGFAAAPASASNFTTNYSGRTSGTTGASGTSTSNASPEGVDLGRWED